MTPISGPALLLGALLTAAVALYFLRRMESVAAIVAAAVSTLIAAVTWRLPLSSPAELAGRTVLLGQPLSVLDLKFQITAAGQALLVFLAGAAAVTFILAWRTYQGRTFYPFGVVLLALWMMAALMQPLTLAPFMVALAAIVAAFLIQAGKPGDTRGAWRQMLFPTLAVPLFLIAAWYIDQAPLNPDDQTPFRVAGWLITAGFVLLLQPAPLHVAFPAVARQAPPVVAAFLWIGGQSTTLFLLQRFLVVYPWLTSAVDSASWLLWLGIFTALTGGLVAAVQDTLGRYTGYASVYDYGVLLVAMALRSTAGVPVTIWLLLTRTVALLTLATGAAIIRHHMQSDRFSEIRGAASRLPWAVTALIVGGLGLAGAPLTAQFASRWALVQLVAEKDTRWSLLLAIGGAAVLIGAVRAGVACFGGLRSSPIEREPAALALISLILVGVSVLLGLFPQLLTAPVAAVILPLSTLGP